MPFYTSNGCSYTGMDTQTIINLRLELGRSTEFVSKEVYESYIAELGVN